MKKSKALWRALLFFILIAALCGSFASRVVNASVQAAPRMQGSLVCDLLMAQWTFDPIPVSSTAPVASTSNVTSSSASGSGQNLSFTGIASSNAWTADSWSPTSSIDSTKFFEFDVSGANYSSMVLTFAVARDSTGPANISIQYSTDGLSYVELQTNSVNISPTLTNITANFSSITGLDNNANAKFRIYGYNAADSARLLYVDNVKFSGCQAATPTPTPTATSTPTKTPGPSLSNIVISEFRTFGTSNEFIELYNPTSNWVDISGWKINASDNNGFVSTLATIPAATILRSGQYYLIANNAYSNSSTNASANLKYSATIVDNGGGIGLLRADNSISDEVGMDQGSAYQEGATLTPLNNPNRSYERKVGGASDSCIDTGDNASDFFRNDSPDPQNYSAPLSLCGSAHPAPIVSITTITADYPDPSLVNAYFSVSVKVTNQTGVSAATPSGKVNITGASTVCTITLNSSGTGSCVVKFTSTGGKTLTATYLGDNLHLSSNDTESHSVTGTTTYRTPTPIPLPPPQLVVINEFVPRPGHDWNHDGVVNTGDEFIELLNHGTVDVNLSGWRLDDEVNIGSNPYSLPAKTIKPGERIVFYGSDTGIHLDDGGDAVRLLKPNGQLIDAYNYTIARYPDESFCRLPDNGGADDWNQYCFPTPGTQNSLSGNFVSSPTNGFEQPSCPVSDTLPEEFVQAECDPFGNNIWSQEFWDRTGWYDEKNLPSIDGKWPVFAD